VEPLATEKLAESLSVEACGLHEQLELLLGLPIARTTDDSHGRLRRGHAFLFRIPKPSR